MNLQEINRRVLIVDDSPEIHADFGKILSPATARLSDLSKLQNALFGAAKTTRAAVTPAIRFEVDFAFQGEQSACMVQTALAAEKPYSVAFVDMRMPPGWDGLRTIRELWKLDPMLNVVICTAYSDHSWWDIEALAGDSDRLVVLKKPFEAIEVKRLAATMTAKWTQAQRAALRTTDLEGQVRVRTAELEMARQLDHRRLDELENVVQERTVELRRVATHDDLTGLPNRTLFHDRLVRALAQSKRNSDYRLAVLFIDFDRFKVVNDSLGHHAGDKLLRGIAQRLSAVLRPTDSLQVPSSRCTSDVATAARLGGDEFCVLLEGLRRDEDAAIVADRILKTLAEPYQIDGREVHSTASIGVAVSSTGYDRAEEIIRDADTAMYRAKATGKGRFVLFDRRMHEQAFQRFSVGVDLQQAIGRGELRTYFQPVVSLTNGTLSGFEALVRWDRGSAGIIGPVDFIDVAEETGFVNDLGQWVFADACRQLADWQRRIPTAAEATMSVNVSPKQLANPLLRERLMDILQDTQVNPRSIILEITESAFVERSGSTAMVLSSLRDLGVRIYLDDFGTGYASLSCLHQFPLDGLKIDRSFIRDGVNNRKYAAVVYAIANLAQNLNLDVIAEGVESLEQVALLQSLDCNKAQGYLFSPPVTAIEAEAFTTRIPWRTAA